METWDAITSRRNVRQFDARTISDADLDRILEAGRRAPSARNRQPWDFVLVTDRAQLGELSKVWRGAGHVADAAAAVALVTADSDDERSRSVAQYDLGQCTMQMLIAAADLGIASGHASVDDQDQARRVLGLPQDRIAVYILDFGYPADRRLKPIVNPDRRPFDEVVHRGRF